MLVIPTPNDFIAVQAAVRVGSKRGDGSFQHRLTPIDGAAGGVNFDGVGVVVVQLADCFLLPNFVGNADDVVDNVLKLRVEACHVVLAAAVGRLHVLNVALVGQRYVRFLLEQGGVVVIGHQITFGGVSGDGRNPSISTMGVQLALGGLPYVCKRIQPR